MGRTDLTPEQWAKLEPELPGNPRHGHAYKPHLPVINGILWRLKTGAPWRDIPERYGPWETCWDRFTRWSRDGTWKRVLVALQVKEDAQGKIDWDGASLDSTSCKAHRAAVGARKQPAKLGKKGALNDEWLGISRGGRNSKIHVLTEGKRRPLAVLVSEGQASDPTYLLPLLDEVCIRRPGPGRPRKRPPMVRVDRAYGARKYRQQLRSRKIVCVCPERKDAKKARLKKGSRGGRPPKFDAEADKGRQVVECNINRLKDFRALATRYEKRGHQFLAVVHVACIVLWL
ncbi:IS5 family transposase [Deinococcus rubellus]|uniref:IS5 family transposase n=2 Tax=Deinococcus rubellus TaxID=1889240 RepID=A0ABY5YD74_9DEIO|nr:IS5 family transposase [Deinococcus rubellus]UWX62989.1 IS5 family transposase [Deinococcus rubellus]